MIVYFVYFWQHTAGTSVGLSDANGATSSFTAPMVPTPEDLSFRLTVVDNRGAGTSDAVVIRVEPQASPADTNAPSTHYLRSTSEWTVYPPIPRPSPSMHPQACISA
ncbi:MAG: PKD domain-containing protein [Gammaproteobacteria bacterium]